MKKMCALLSCVVCISYCSDENKNDNQPQSSMTFSDLKDRALEKYLQDHPEVLEKLDAIKDKSLEEKLAVIPDELLMNTNGCLIQ